MTRKLIAAINMTLDGVCDHTAVDADDDLHDHYTELLRSADTAIYGRKTYQLMEYWREVLANPTGNRAADEFAVIMDKIHKLVYSRTLKSVDWESAELRHEFVKEDIEELKQNHGKDILAGSPSVIVQLANLGMVDEFQFAVHPTVAGSGMKLFKNISERIDLELLGTKAFRSGAVVLYYRPVGRKGVRPVATAS